MAESLPIAMEYLGGARPGTTRVVTPLGVMQNRGQIYLTALCHQSNCEKTFRLDRIAAFRRLE
jgi:predicted DNA-binding transcriptional regulator YafY